MPPENSSCSFTSKRNPFVSTGANSTALNLSIATPNLPSASTGFQLPSLSRYKTFQLAGTQNRTHAKTHASILVLLPATYITPTAEFYRMIFKNSTFFLSHSGTISDLIRLKRDSHTYRFLAEPTEAKKTYVWLHKDLLRKSLCEKLYA